MNLFWAALVGAVLAVLGYFQAKHLDLLKDLDTSLPRHECRHLAGGDWLMGAEDLVLLGKATVLGIYDDKMKLWENALYGPDLTPNGGLFVAYDIDRETPQIQRLTLTGFPEDVAFHPHGMYLVRDQSKLYVINHAYNKGGERIEVFRITHNDYRQVQVSYDSSVTSLLFNVEAMGALNDVVVTGPDELYVTQYRPFPDGLDGRHSPSVLARTHFRLNMLMAIHAIQPRWTRVLYCKGSDCRPTEGATTGFSYNGINRSPDGKRLLVANMKSIEIFEMDQHRLRKIQTVEVDHIVDNIEVMEDAVMQEAYTLGVIGRAYSYLIHNIKSAHIPDGSRPNYNVPGGAQILFRDGTTGKYMVQDVLMTDGSQLSLISCAVRVGGKYIMGSWGAQGLLVCSDRPPSSRVGPQSH